MTIINGLTGIDKIVPQSLKILDAINTDEALSKGQLLTEMKAVDGVGSGLDADTVQGVPKDLLGIGGAGYSWVDETSNRAVSTTYTNTYGKPITVNIKYQSDAALAFQPYLTIGGSVNVYGGGSNGNNGEYHIVTAIIPNGFTYVFNNDNSRISTNGWAELK